MRDHNVKSVQAESGRFGRCWKGRREDRGQMSFTLFLNGKLGVKDNEGSDGALPDLPK